MTAVAALSPPRGAEGVAAEMRIGLLDGFAVTKAERPLSLPMGAQRLVAFLTLHRGRRSVRSLPGRSGPRRPRSARSRTCARRSGASTAARSISLPLAASSLRSRRASGSIFSRQRRSHGRPSTTRSGALDLAPSRLSADLLPDWYDDWALIEREQYRQLRLRALDGRSSRLIAAGRYADALEAGLAAVAGEPLRESAHRAVVQVHLAEGNIGEAIRQYRSCCRLLQERLGLEPSQLMERLFDHVTERRRSGDRSRT